MRWKVNWLDTMFGWSLVTGMTLLFFVMTACIVRHSNATKSATIDSVHTTLPSELSSFYIYYREGKKERVECESCIYGQTDDKIYFMRKSGKDTVKVVPKIEVEKVVEK